MALSETGKWLEQELLQLRSGGDSVIQLDSETLYSLVSYCEMATPADASEYLLNIVGDHRCNDIVAEYLVKRGASKVAPDVGMQAYQKPRDEEPWSTGTKKTPKQKSRVVEAPGIASSQKDPDHQAPLLSGNGVLSAENIIQKGKRPVGKGKKGGKGVSLEEASKGLVMFARNGPCNCQCTRHKLINNCLSCGRVVCEQEGEGPCHFCGVLVLKEGSDYGGLEGLAVPPSTEAEAAAEEFKNRLVEYDRTATSRTKVIDDQSDYFEIEGNTWLTEKEKRSLQERLMDEERNKAERSKRVVVTIDLLGRKVIAGQGDGDETGERVSILGSEVLLGQDLPKVSRVTPNPYLAETPTFIGSGQYPETQARKSSSRKTTELLRSGRIQHNDPLTDALSGHVSKDLESNGARHSPEARAFDICPPLETGKSKAVVLSPSILVLKQTERKEALSETDDKNKQPSGVLLPGMVLLKRWLSPEQQVDIVNYCRTVGIGPGGFYKPEYGDHAKMHLQMMCLGMQWEPTSKSYGSHRSHHDNASPPSIPDSFTKLVDESLVAARVAATQDSRGKSKRDKLDKWSTVPEMVPNVCIVNFYEQSGNLGMHQDKDESAESLRKECPVVSFSIGDSAEFIYGKQRDVLNAEKVVLESGDVLIFGGPSRMIYHGVTQVISDTSPRWLSQKTNLRQGRLNLTFRQY